jgi:adenylyltransferase/sulfurtransferase|tara:strand:+ start:441 stop:599 length:159 start_codon:yes stop_codon:yes gene_type:complete
LLNIETIKDKNIIVYCRSGARSSKATKTLLRNGFNVFNLSGGIMGWEGEMEL